MENRSCHLATSVFVRMYRNTISVLVKTGGSVVLFGMILFLAACGSAGSNETTPGNLGAPAYPAGASLTVDDANAESYPVTSNTDAAVTIPDPYPAEDNADSSGQTVFDLDTPLNPGATVVSGHAPPNLTLSVVDMTFNGAVLGNGRSDEEGLFEIQVTALPAGHRIGILLAEADTGLTYQETLDKYFPFIGDGALNIPNIGLLFDSDLVSEG
ncbi:MAG: hypothetical protein M9941_06540 [Anaerolineae bacterium]|nr:hypothetical protein [Anaerolineae bacterium]MCO5197394.1 hypothetical protein [Anaerolineae bacterium]